MQLDLFELRDDDDLRREVQKINADRRYHPKEVCDILGCSLSMIYRLYGSGELRGLRVGLGIRIFGWSVRKYIVDNSN